MEQLRGRNLAHVGCTLGLVVGLMVGLIVGLLVLQIVRGDSAASFAGLAWIGVTFVLGAAGYALGSYMTRRLWGRPTDAEHSPTPRV